MKKLLYIATIALLVASCSTSNVSSNSCLKKRAAFDIGSGSTKMVVARVNTCEKKIDNIIFEAQRPLAFKQDLINSKNNEFSSTMISKAVATFNELKSQARGYGVTNFSGMATSAFRTADNGKSVLKTLKKRTGITLEIINQETEARLGYLGATDKIKNKDRPFVVWDIGGGSMQITQKNGDNWEHYLGKIASVSFNDQVLKKYYKKGRKTPNPLGKKRALKSIELSRKFAQRIPVKFKDLKNIDVYGIGGVHYYSIRKQTKVKDYIYDQNAVYSTLLKRSKLSDRKIGGPYAKTDVTNLSLVLGHMQVMNISKVKTLKVNMAHGLLLHEKSWY